MATPRTLTVKPALLETLAALRPALETSGSVQARRYARRASYRLRWSHQDEHGRRRQRSLALGDEENAAAVRALIEQWRREARVRRERERIAAAACADRLARVREKYVALGGRSRHSRRRLRLKFDEAAAGGEMALLSLAMMAVWDLVHPPAGRPRTGGSLW